MLADQTLDRREKIWKAVTEAVAKHIKNNKESIVLDNEAICIWGKK